MLPTNEFGRCRRRAVRGGGASLRRSPEKRGSGYTCADGEPGRYFRFAAYSSRSGGPWGSWARRRGIVLVQYTRGKYDGAATGRVGEISPSDWTRARRHDLICCMCSATQAKSRREKLKCVRWSHGKRSFGVGFTMIDGEIGGLGKAAPHKRLPNPPASMAKVRKRSRGE